MNRMQIIERAKEILRNYAGPGIMTMLEAVEQAEGECTMTTEERRSMGAREIEVMETPNVWLVGDSVRLFDAPYGWATVVKVTEDEVELVRPFVHTSDFSVSAGEKPGERILDYMGQERCRYSRTSKHPLPTVFRAVIPR